MNSETIKKFRESFEQRSASSQVARLEEDYADLARLTGNILATVEANLIRNIIVVVDSNGEISDKGREDLNKILAQWKEGFAKHEKQGEAIQKSKDAGTVFKNVWPRPVYVADVEIG